MSQLQDKYEDLNVNIACLIKPEQGTSSALFRLRSYAAWFKEMERISSSLAFDS